MTPAISATATILQRIFAAGWARRDPDSRAITCSAAGTRSFERLFG